jgi:ATP-dependent helicase/nuclease subunit B
MLSPLINIAPFRDAIAENQLILTANQRLAMQIKQAWGKLSQHQNISVWRSPRVMSIEHWTMFLWNELKDQNHPLVSQLSIVGTMQSQYYWEKALTQGQLDLSLDKSFATMAANCLDLLQRWTIDFNEVSESSSSFDKFKNWAIQYQTLLNKNQLVTVPQASQLIADCFLTGALNKETQINLYGFQSISPLQERLLEITGEEYRHIQSNNTPVTARRIECADPTAEFAVASKWAALELLKNPNQRIGILIPDLNNNLTKIVRIMNETLAEQQCSTAVNISAGVKLSDTTLIKAAFNCLDLFNFELPLSQWLCILYSPFNLFEKLPIQFKVNAELKLRALKSHRLGLDQFIQVIRGEQSILATADELQNDIQPLYSFQQYNRENQANQYSFSQWAAILDKTVKQLGWPGLGQPSSIQYQQIQQWDKLLVKLAELDNLGIEVGRSKALYFLNKLASEQLFHPQTGDAPLQILGLLEGSGLVFDKLWVTGMHSGNLPTSGSIDPVLSANFQRQYQMPFSVPEKELTIAKSLLSSFEENTNHLFISYPLSDGKTPLEPSALIKDIEPQDVTALVGDINPAHWLQQANQTDLIEEPGYAFDAAVEPIRGGSSILKHQSTCPFNAFAQHRLWAHDLDEPSIGLEAMDRGSIVHEILYRLWDNWKTSTVLMDLTDEQLALQTENTVKAVLLEQAKTHSWLQGENYLALEQTRLSKMILQWLEVEKQRPSFDVIATEQKITMDFGKLSISLSLDRLDEVDGHPVVIDYKTGNVSSTAWHGDRPKDPQLPLYVLASEPMPEGCFFGHLKGTKFKYLGISKDPIISGLKPADDWQLQIDQWQTAINQLAQEFILGKASVIKYHDSEFNFQTELLPLNRWQERNDIQRLLKDSTP